MSREFLEDFIKIYESEPCLWHVKSKLYHDRVKRDAAYERLIEQLKKIEPNSASRDSVLKKINNIRSAYRKEIKKVKASQKSGAGTDELYEPKLWYFKLLRFLDDQETPRSSRSTLGSDEDDVISNNEENGEENVSQDINANNEAETLNSEDATWIENAREVTAGQSVSTVTPQRRPPQKRKRQETQEQTLTNEVLFTVKEHFKTPRTAEDRFDVFGKTVAMKLRTLPTEQMLIAEKQINDTLFQAEMGNLSYRLVGEAIHQSYTHNFNQYRSPYSSPPFSNSYSPSPSFSASTPTIQPQQQYQKPQSQLNYNQPLLCKVTDPQQKQSQQPVANNYFSQFNE